MSLPWPSGLFLFFLWNQGTGLQACNLATWGMMLKMLFPTFSVEHFRTTLLNPGIILVTLASTSLFPGTVTAEPSYDERLVPVVTTFLSLQLCASFASEDPALAKEGEKYAQISWSLYDEAVNSGWDEQNLAAALVVAHEQRASLKVEDGDTHETFRRRHQSGKPCEEAVTTAKTYLNKGLPKPDGGRN